jgi:hypothetical protein
MLFDSGGDGCGAQIRSFFLKLFRRLVCRVISGNCRYIEKLSPDYQKLKL